MLGSRGAGSEGDIPSHENFPDSQILRHRHLQCEEAGSFEGLPQVAENKTPRSMDVTGEH
jgi:hypothetical protein